MASKPLRRQKYDGTWYPDAISTAVNGVGVVIMVEQ